MAFTRRDIGYTIISRFEESFRSYLADKLTSIYGNYAEGIPVGIVEKAKERSGSVSWETANDFLEETNFPDLMEIVCYKGAIKNYFPDLDISQKDFQEVMDGLYLLRCKIAHVKQYFNSFDLDKLLELSQDISKHLNVYGNEFADYIHDLKQSPEKFVLPTPVEFVDDTTSQIIGIPNNVPTPDYEFEGGFVGREEDIKKITNLLEGNLHKVITISGAGGVGKTALALRVVQKIAQKKQKGFDGIVWLSAKETKLSYVGIEDIEPTVKNYEQLLDTILSVMGMESPDSNVEKKENDVQALFDLYNCILIVIDNLETITDERITNFILDAHPKVKILITSRKGLGQVERRYELKQLKEKEAIFLFRTVAKDKNLDKLAAVDDETIKLYAQKVSFYPLAIKWVIGQVAIGKDINTVINEINETSSDISRFCFEQIYRSLSRSARKILCALSVFDEPPSAGILNYILDLNQHEFEDSISELILVSLAIPEQYKTEQNELANRYNLLSLTRGYVRQQLDTDPTLKQEILGRLQTVQVVVEEAERAKKQYRFSLANLGAITEEEKVAAMIAQTAFQKYQAGRYIDAVEEYKRAVKIAPRFASLYRNWAVMESDQGHTVESEELMKKASDLNPHDPQIWLTWGNIKRREDKVKEALQKYEKAFEISPSDAVILNALGQAKSRLAMYEEADGLFRQALEKSGSEDTIRHRIINMSSLAENLVRWADSCVLGRAFKEAEDKLNEANNICEEVVKLDRNDSKSLDLHRKVMITMGFLYKKQCNFELAVEFFFKSFG